MKSIKLSVVVPAYGVEEYIAECLRSILRDPMEDMEVLVINDCTRDSSARIAQEFARHDARVRVIHHDQNMGLGAARNTGLRLALGEYITFPDSDDIVVAGAYARMLNSLDETGSSFATGPAQEFGDKRKRYWTTDTPVFDEDRSGVDIAAYPALIEDHTAWNKVFRRSFLLSNGIDWPVGVKCEDVVPSVRAYAAAVAVDVVADVVYLYRRRRDSITTALGSAAAFADWVDQSIAALRAADDAPSAAKSNLAEKILVREYLGSVRLSAVPDAAPDVQQTLHRLAELGCRYLASGALTMVRAADRLRIGLTAGGHFEELARWCDRSASVRQDDLEAATTRVPAEFRRLLGFGAVDSIVRPGAACDVSRDRVEQTGSARAESPELSVIVPTCNVGEYLDETLRSILAARHVDLEVIVVDDWSTDNTREIASLHERRDRRVRAVRSVGRGGGQARNLGVELARGHYLAFADGDDIVPPDAYWKMISVARSSSAELVTAKHLRVYPSSIWDPSDRLYPLVGTITDTDISEYVSLIHPRTVWNRVYLKEFWSTSVAPFCGAPRANDIVPFTSAVLHAKKIAFVPVFSYLYRARPGRASMTAKLGDPSSVVSYMSEELTCSQMVASSGDPRLIAKYWHTVLTEDGWGNLKRYLAAQTWTSFDDLSVAPWVARLLDAAPVDAYRAISPEQQAVWALVAKGEIRFAREMTEAAQKAGALTFDEMLKTIEAAVLTDALSDKALDYIIWKHLVRRVINDRRSLTPEQAESAVRVFQSSGRASRFVAVPGTFEDQVVRATLLDLPERLLDLDAPTARPDPADVRFSADFLHLSGTSVPSATDYRWLFRRGHDDAGHVLRVPVALVQYDSVAGRWTADVPRVAFEVTGRWELWMSYEDAVGVRSSSTGLVIEDAAVTNGSQTLTEGASTAVRHAMRSA